MSLSIQQLIGALKHAPGNVPAPEGKLFNPDIPTLGGDKKRNKTQQNIRDSRDEKKTRYFTAMRSKPMPRNGNYFRIGDGRGGVQDKPLANPRLDDMYMEGHIDPKSIRHRTNPAQGLPGDYAYGQLDYMYSLPADTHKATNSIGLITDAHKSYVNYRNRFALPVTGTPGDPVHTQPITQA